jgi:hypothetical protein
MTEMPQRTHGKPSQGERRLWQLVALGAGVAAAALVRGAAVLVWRKGRHEDPPVHPSARGVSLADALLWAVSLAVGAAVSKVFAERAAAEWQKATGSPPPNPNG